MTKQELLESGTQLVRQFCEVNGLEMPAVRSYASEEWRFGGVCAYYRPVAIHIALSRCAAPGRAGSSWSWPGYVIDRTPHGVMAHELGHHVDHVLSTRKGAYGGDFSVGLRARTCEDKITNYCPNDWEWFAEIFRLFVTNPDLLSRLRPKTFKELEAVFKPDYGRTWEEVLEGAPERTIAMARRKIVEAKKPRQGQLL